jgi:hypothetical protein
MGQSPSRFTIACNVTGDRRRRKGAQARQFDGRTRLLRGVPMVLPAGGRWARVAAASLTRGGPNAPEPNRRWNRDVARRTGHEREAVGGTRCSRRAAPHGPIRAAARSGPRARMKRMGSGDTPCPYGRPIGRPAVRGVTGSDPRTPRPFLDVCRRGRPVGVSGGCGKKKN